MDNLTRDRIIELHMQGTGINQISKIFKIKKQEINKIISSVEVVGQSVGHEVRHEEEVAVTVLEDNNNTAVTLKEQEQLSLEYLTNNIEVFVHFMEQYKKENIFGQQKPNNKIEIRLGREESNYKTSIRVNQFVMDKFREFCKDHNEFTTKDLLSMALLEYMEKYK
ncbi:MAG: hypothetical protein ACRCTZ_01260 [Sarcina sp.]